jgi:hypothetical protein
MSSATTVTSGITVPVRAWQATTNSSQGGTQPSGANAIAILDKWTPAFERCKAQLSPRETSRILQIGTYEEMKAAIVNLQREYKQKTITRAFARIEPFLQNLRSFNGVIDTAIQANPAISALCWGGIKLVLEVSHQTIRQS